jgi:hypothetical protein
MAARVLQGQTATPALTEGEAAPPKILNPSPQWPASILVEYPKQGCQQLQRCGNQAVLVVFVHGVGSCVL